jgi:hypothetical protein
MFRGRHRNARGKMFQPDSGLRLILSLPPRATRSIGLNDHLLLEDLRIGIEFHSLQHLFFYPLRYALCVFFFGIGMMFDDQGIHQEDYIFGDIGGVIGNAFETPTNNDQMDCSRDGLLI